MGDAIIAEIDRYEYLKELKKHLNRMKRLPKCRKNDHNLQKVFSVQKKKK